MLTARYRQNVLDRIRYVHGLEEWLAEGEVITGFAVVAEPGITIDDVAALPPVATAFQFVVSGGLGGYSYAFAIVVTTSDNQRYTSNFEVMVEEALVA
jgi:hypothetical protein